MGFPMFNKYTYIVPDEKKEKEGLPFNIKSLYVNTEACKNCPIKEECLGKQHHKTYTISGSAEKRAMAEKMRTDEAQEIYNIRGPAIESIFGVFKLFYYIDALFFKGREKIENILNLYSIGYNLNKIYDTLINQVLIDDDKYQSFVMEKISKYQI